MEPNNNFSESKSNIFEGVKTNSNGDLPVILSFLTDTVSVQNLIKKLSINVNQADSVNLKEILSFLSKANPKLNNSPPIKDIIEQFKIVFSDGKLDLYDIPQIINIINTVLNMNMNDLKMSIDAQTIGLLIKFLIHMLINLKIINTNQTNNETIDKMIDASLSLLNTTIAVSKIKCSFNCCK